MSFGPETLLLIIKINILTLFTSSKFVCSVRRNVCISKIKYYVTFLSIESCKELFLQGGEDIIVDMETQFSQPIECDVHLNRISAHPCVFLQFC